MRGLPVLPVLVFAAWVGIPAGTIAQERQEATITAPYNTAEFIVQTVAGRARENELAKRERLSYKRIYRVEGLNDKGQVTEKKKEEVVLIEAGGQERLVEKNGKPMNQLKTSKPKFNLIGVLEAIAKTDEIRVVRIEMLGDRPSFVISFGPKPNQKADGGDVEEIILRSEGTMYVDMEKFYIRKISARLIKPYTRALGIFTLSSANLFMEQEEFNGIFVMKTIEIVDQYSLFWGSTFEKQTYEYKEYQQK